MDSSTIKQLIKLNKQFYQTFALQFSATRERLQPGVLRILEMIPSDANVLDLGCGNGELARELARRGHQGYYLGLDFSRELLDVSRAGRPDSSSIFFSQADLSNPKWDELEESGQWSVVSNQKAFDIVLAFATMHHLPSKELHLTTFKKVQNLLNPNGRFIHSNWQFLNSPRLKARIQPWEEIGLTSDLVDNGDYLLDWRRGGYGLRYVHLFSEAELHELADETGFTIRESFYSDGQEGNLALYQIWEKRKKLNA